MICFDVWRKNLILYLTISGHLRAHFVTPQFINMIAGDLHTKIETKLCIARTINGLIQGLFSTFSKQRRHVLPRSVNGP